MVGSRTGERSAQHGSRSQNARSPEAPATLPEHRVLVVHQAPTRWLGQLTARAGVIVFFSASYDNRISTVRVFLKILTHLFLVFEVLDVC